MTNVTMKATDTLHVSSVGPDNIPPNGEFVVSSGTADELEKRGLATRVEGGSKAEPVVENKAEPAPANKTISSASLKAPAARKGKN